MAGVEVWKKSQEMPATIERRRHQRFSLQAPVQLILPDKGESMSALNQEISWGGAIFTASEPLPRGVSSLLVNLPWVRDQHISIHAKILRTALLPNNQYLIVVRFSSLMPESHVRLEKLLKMLSGQAQGVKRKGSADLFPEVQVSTRNPEDFRKVLEKIAAGRFILHTVNWYEQDQSISLAVACPDHPAELRLRARVIGIQTTHRIRFDGSNLHLVNLEFEHPRDSIAPLIGSLLRRLPRTDIAPALSESSRTGKKPGAPVSNSRCAIEVQFPAVLAYLIAVWHNDQAFSKFFLELLDVGHAGSGWPAEIWEELVLLQNVHKQVHGATNPGSLSLRGATEVTDDFARSPPQTVPSPEPPDPTSGSDYSER
ncbi:PilZ domain-containing protein [uncultured Thiodictyon sp.]|uniref:PilZ domain-containing protein n=1 Tax=uncultured Thiodictyon sp. TaxID=1846217 RepID=UPI0025E8815D|nr:PilZ domain-containing protein [uncultured Thiodictyon sp.]